MANKRLKIFLIIAAALTLLVSAALFTLFHGKEYAISGYVIKSKFFKTAVTYGGAEILNLKGSLISADVLRGKGGDKIALVISGALSKYGDRIVVCSERGKVLYDKDWSLNKPWKIRMGDVNDDGEEEFAVGVYKKSPFDPVMARRVFIYKLREKDNALQAVFRASKTVQSLADFEVYEDSLVCLERGEKGMIVRKYGPLHFGYAVKVQAYAPEGANRFTRSEKGIFIGNRELGNLNFEEVRIK